MATPAAILSILLSADTDAAQAKLTQYQRKLAQVEATSKKGISARLGGSFDDAAFAKYQAATDKAIAKARDRRAFKAELGANFSPAGFRAYQAALAQTSRDAAQATRDAARQSALMSAQVQKAIDQAARDAATKSAQMRDTFKRNLSQAGQYGAAGVAVAGVAVGKLAVDFDRAMRNVNSIAQLPEGSLKSLEKQVLSLAGKTAQAPITLAEGLYDLVSSGFNAKQSMTILAASAKAATAGLTDTATSTRAVAAVLNAYHQPASAAAKVSDVLFQTVNLGVISFAQLAGSIGTVLPFAAQLNVGLNQVGAAISTMTKQGIGPDETMTRLRQIFVSLLKPSTDLSKAIKQTGFDSGESLLQAKGLQGALEDLLGTTNGSKSAVAALFPNVRALGGVLALTGTNAHGANADLKQFGNTAGATNRALSQQSQSVAYQWNKLLDTIKAAAITFGSKAIPAVLKFVQQMKDGKGAGGQFASTIKSAFNTIKTVIHDAVDELGGLKTTLEVLAGGWAVTKLLKLGGAIATIAKGSKIASGAVGAATGGAGAVTATEGATGVLAKAAGVLSRASALAFLAPVGIALGVVVDKWINTRGEAEGKAWADKFTKNLPGKLSDAAKKGLADATQKVISTGKPGSQLATVQTGGNPYARILSPSKPSGQTGGNPFSSILNPGSVLNAAAFNKQFNKEFDAIYPNVIKAGEKTGESFVAGWQQVKFPSEPALIASMKEHLNDVPKAIKQDGPGWVQTWKDLAGKQMLEYAESLQQQGKLPVKAVGALIKSLERQIPGFDQYLTSRGLSTDQALAKTLKFTAASATLTSTLKNFRSQFGVTAISTKITAQNMEQNLGEAMTYLRQNWGSQVPATRKAMIAEFQLMHDQATALFSSMVKKTTQAAKDMQGFITSSTSATATAAAGNLSGLANAIYGAVKSGALNSKQGLDYIQKAFNATLKAYGSTQIPAVTLQDVALSSPFSPNVGAFSKTGVGGGGKPAGAARGGLMQIGRPGQAGQDSVGMNVGGIPIRVAPGEQVAVFNRHQLPIVNAALAPMGGLPGLFSKVSKPNYMATGGIIPGFASGGVFAQDEGLWTAAGGPRSVAPIASAISLAESGGRDIIQQGQPYGTTGWGRWQITPGNSEPQFGIDQALLIPINNARAAVAKWANAPGGGRNFSPWTTFNDGAYRGFLQGGGALASLGALAQSISAPKVTGNGAVANLLKGGLGKVAAAANAYIAKQAATLGGAIGSGAGGLAVGPAGGGFDPSQLGTLDGFQVAKWIIPEALWARGRGWAGKITSGWRSPSDVVHGLFETAPQGQSEHRLDIYPGGAIDVSDYQQFAQIIASYPGAQRLIQLASDPLHFSGTGHARGGIVGSPVGPHGPSGTSPLSSAEKGQARNAIDGIWSKFKSRYPKGAVEPQIQFPATGIPSKDPLYKGLEYAYTIPAEHTSFFMPGYVRDLLNPKSSLYPWAYKNVIHEFAHDFQSQATLAQEWTREGGASAFATEVSPQHASDSSYIPFETRVFKQKGFPWVYHGQFGAANGGMIDPLPFAGSFDKGGVVPGQIGQPMLGLIHGGEVIHPTGFASGGSIISSALQGHPNWITAAEQKTIATARKQIAAAAVTALVKQLGNIPSQGIGGQIQLAGLSNQLQSAQNSGDTGGQQKALNAMITLEQGWLGTDKAQLKKINKQLAKRGLSKNARAGLLDDKLALLQEIGTVSADIGSSQSSLSDLTSSSTDTSGTDTSGSGTDDGAQALADAINAQTQALTDATTAINEQTSYMKSVDAVTTNQAIKALSDVISGNIGGRVLSRQTGSAGDGTVVRY